MDLPQVVFVAGTLGLGGAEHQLSHHLTELHRRGCRPVVLSLTRGEAWEERIRDAGVPVVGVGGHGSRLSRAVRVVEAVQNVRPDVVQSAHFFTNLYAAMAGRALGIPDIGAVRSDVRWAVASMGRLGRSSLMVPSHLAINSHRAARQTRGLGVPSHRITVVPNVIDGERFQTQRTATTGPTIEMLSVGRLIPTKRFDRLLRIVSEIRQAGEQIRVTVLGGGPERAQLEAMATRSGLSGVVSFEGQAADPTAAYRRADVFILTSDFEGTPNVVMEAMASGLPVVSTDVGDVRDLIPDDRFGFVRDAGDLGGLVRCVRTLLADANLRLHIGRRAEERIRNQRGLDRLGGFLHELYVDCGALLPHNATHGRSTPLLRSDRSAQGWRSLYARSSYNPAPF